MSAPSVLLSSLLPINAVQLGRLVQDIRFPDQDFFQSAETLVTGNDIITQRLENFAYSTERTEKSGMSLLLSTLVSGNKGSERGSTIDISSATCITHVLQNSGQFFEKICASRPTKAWLERMLRRRMDVYMVTGIKTVADAEVGTGNKKGANYEGKAQVPTGAAAGLPLPDGFLDVGAGGYRSAETSEKTSFLAPGEQIFAVQYRKMRAFWVSSRDVDAAYLESGNRWKVYVGGRGTEQDGEAEKIVNIEVGDYIQDDDIPETCDTFQVEGEEYICIE